MLSQALQRRKHNPSSLYTQTRASISPRAGQSHLQRCLRATAVKDCARASFSLHLFSRRKHPGFRRTVQASASKRFFEENNSGVCAQAYEAASLCPPARSEKSAATTASSRALAVDELPLLEHATLVL
jgi:uncharacterized protein (DUF58 family)